MADQSWYSVCRSYRRDTTEEGKQRRSFEERAVLFRAESFEAALAKGEAEARRYVADLAGGRMLDRVVAYLIHDDDLREGDEIWSCIRDLDISDEEFLRQVYAGEYESFSNAYLHPPDA